jgi:AraC-like DNA-binding protein
MQSTSNSQVSPRYLRALLHHLAEQGLDAQASLDAAGMSLAMLEHPDAHIDREHITLIMRDLSQRSGRTDLGFELGMVMNIVTADVVGQLLLSAATLAEGLRRMAAYFPLLTPSFRVQYTVGPANHILDCQPSRPLPYDMALQGLESMAVAFHRVVLFLLQTPTAPTRLDLSWAAPPHAARYRTLKGAKVHFGQGAAPRFLMQIPAELAVTPLPMTNPLALMEAEQTCQRRLAAMLAERSWREWVQHMLRTVNGHFPSQDELAALMGFSARTLARHLEAEGEPYRVLAKRVRHEHALELLTTTAMSLAEIAQALGYSDAANFGRAFKAIAGINPGEYRRA